eukprot:1157870-Pelagomonas_calceolata.AAC.11
MQSQAIHELSLTAKYTLELKLATAAELSPEEHFTGFFCFTGCPFLDSLELEAWFGLLRAAGWELLASAISLKGSLSWGHGRSFLAQALFSPMIAE